MSPEQWARLMRQARAHALLHGHRVKVVAVRMSPRTARQFGVSWVYVIDCPSRAADFMRGH